jgi:ectoine hydrolase
MPSPRPHFTRDEYDARIARTREAMAVREIDLIIIEENMTFHFMTGLPRQCTAQAAYQ